MLETQIHKHYIPVGHREREWLLLRENVVVEKFTTPRDDECAFCFADSLLTGRPDIDTVASVVARR